MRQTQEVTVRQSEYKAKRPRQYRHLEQFPKEATLRTNQNLFEISTSTDQSTQILFYQRLENSSGVTNLVLQDRREDEENDLYLFQIR